jgi:hypothetical protein
VEGKGGGTETEEAKWESTERKRETLNNSYIVSQLLHRGAPPPSALRCFSFEPPLIRMTEGAHSSVKMMTIIIINVAFVLFVP